MYGLYRCQFPHIQSNVVSRYMNVAVKNYAGIVCMAKKIQCGTSYLQLKDEIYPIMNILCRIFKVESRPHPRFLLTYI